MRFRTKQVHAGVQPDETTGAILTPALLEGVPPDHEVVEYPKDLIAGRDPQLEQAVALALPRTRRSQHHALTTLLLILTMAVVTVTGVFQWL